jgi:hypothetical protein
VRALWGLDLRIGDSRGKKKEKKQKKKKEEKKERRKKIGGKELSIFF